MRTVQKAYAITDAKISFVSLVDKAANKRKFLITKAENGEASFVTYGRIIKADTIAPSRTPRAISSPELCTSRW